MDRLRSGQLGARSAPRFGVTMFRGRSGADAGLLDASPVQTPPLSQRASPPPRPPRPPRRPIQPNRSLGILVVIVIGLVAALCVPFLFGGDAYWDHNMRGNADYGQGDWDGAVTEYGKMIALDPKRQDGYSLRAMAYFKLHQYRLSAADDRMALQYIDNTESRAVLFQNLAYSEDYDNDHAQAIRDFSEAIALDPSIPDTPDATADAHDDTGDSHKGRMWAYYESGQYPLAMADCQALIARDPYPSSIAVRGKIYRKMGNYASAVRDFRTALREEPTLSFASDQLTEVLGEMHQFSGAVRVAEAAAQANPSSADWRANIGWWQYRAGEVAQAILSDKQALAMGGRQPITLANLGLAYATRGDWPDAKPILAQELRISSFQERHGALVDVRRALTQQPHSVALRRALALLWAAK